MSLLEGLISLPWWGYIVVALVLTHITIAAVTIYLHRHQAHRALDLHPIVSHFFRFWLWLTTGMVTKEWAAIHRKHHAKVETVEDPHSPVIHGIKKLVWDGTDLYRKASRDKSIMEKYGHGTPDDWLERNVYTRHSSRGILIMMAIDLALFGPIGLTIWAVQMVWIPFFAAGIINGVGHWWGYRNYEVADTSTNIVPWGIIIGGEELHNNHHTFGSSAKLSSKWYEFDIGWMYIRLMQMVGLATVKKIPPELTCDTAKQHIDLETVKAVINARFVVLSHFLREVVERVHREELAKAKPESRESWALLKSARRVLVREGALLDENSKKWLQQVLDRNQRLKTVHMMREKLADVWQRSATTQENLVHALQEWSREAEATGIEALRHFAQKLRTYRLVPVPA
jgi:stearoyl-CoA desaturase (delta-9 desaturase)